MELGRTHHSRDLAVAELIEFFPPTRWQSYPGAGSDSRRPVFVVGMPRSGTTLVEKILASHPKCGGVGELMTLPAIVDGKFANPGGGSRRDRYAQLDPTWIGEAAEAYLHDLAARDATHDHVVDKLPGNYLHLGFIRLLFPQALIIHCRRDPRDVCLSAYFQLFQAESLRMATSRLEWIVEEFGHYDRLMTHWRTVLPQPKIHEIHYERLVRDPRGEVARLLEYCQWGWSDHCLRFHELASTVKTASTVQVRQPLYQSSLGKWRNYWPWTQEAFAPLTDVILDYEEQIS